RRHPAERHQRQLRPRQLAGQHAARGAAQIPGGFLMQLRTSLLLVPLVMLLPLAPGAGVGASVSLNASDPPTSWVDPDTGHRVVRLTTDPDSASLYFNQHGYTADGKRLVYTTPNGISTLDLTTHQTKQVVTGKVRMIEAGRKTSRLYYVRDNTVCWTDADTG